MQDDAYFDTWWLEPRDPLVFGDGGRSPALAAQAGSLLPPQSTAAGLVRTALLETAGDLSAEAARRTLDVRLRGPWLVRRPGAVAELWVPAPVDVAVSGETLLRAELFCPGADEGTLWPSSEDPGTYLVSLPARDEKGAKTKRLTVPFWPLEAAVAWALGEDPSSLLRHVGALGAEVRLPIAPESRVHVAIHPETQTALPEALFSSSGLRFAEEFGLALEVQVSQRDQILPGHGLEPALRVLGGEARTVRCSVGAGHLLPAFDTLRGRFQHHLTALPAAGRVLGLRLQLVTPGAFGDWRPRWPEGLAGRLRALALDRFAAVSGWDLHAGGQRRVRRLVPAGSVFWFGPFESGTQVLDLCGQLWGKPLPSTDRGDLASFQAAPENDGYGVALAFPCSLPKEDS